MMAKVPDFMAHMLEPEKRRWWDRIATEGLRVFVVLVLALGSAYFALAHQRGVDLDGIDARFEVIERKAESLAITATIICQNAERIRENQKSVLLSLLTVTETINDDPNRRRIPLVVRHDILAALANLPSAREC